MAEAYIVAVTRTASGRRGGRLSGWHATDLAAAVLNDVVAKAKADPSLIDDVIMGCVSQIGEQAANIARNAVLASTLPESVPGTSIDRQCGSSQQAIHFAAQAVMSGTQDIVIAAGVESMSRTPMFSPTVLAQKAGMEHYVGPKIQERYPGVEFSQFIGAEMLAKKYGQTRDDLYRFALESHRRAIAATNAGKFNQEILPLQAKVLGDSMLDEMHIVDEGIRFDTTLEGIASVKPLQEGGYINAAVASQISDGASAIMIVNEKGLKKLGLEPLARIHHISVLGHDPVMMVDAPMPATKRALKKCGMSIHDIDLFEVNEAFAPVPLAWLHDTGADPDRLNVNGGAIALGHPLGASGTRLMTTLVHCLHDRGGRYGLQTMCEGGGMANVTIIERL